MKRLQDRSLTTQNVIDCKGFVKLSLRMNAKKPEKYSPIVTSPRKPAIPAGIDGIFGLTGIFDAIRTTLLPIAKSEELDRLHAARDRVGRQHGSGEAEVSHL
jgi:hypothetical protein